ncbi:MAG: glycosyltransferase family 39 protein [Acidobacteria bacterium]|nr:glycosyltransferase family 39 protein [Acidobacteriota bacterium]MBV9476856.1 glycosyltransferase family 39 protein [Acidobacteriota bacterium]
MRLAVFICALLVRLLAIELTGAARIDFGDAADYLATAQSVCAQHVYPERGNLPFFRAPGVPFFILAVTACHPSAARVVKYGLAACDALSVLLIYLLTERLFSRRAALLAAILAAFHPFFVGAVTDIRSEPLFMAFLLLGFWLVVRGNPALAGAAIGLATLTRPTGLLVIPLLALFVFVRDRRGALALVAAAALTLAPWTLRNYLRFHELIVVNDAGGFNLWRGTHPELLRIVQLRDRDAFARGSQHFESVTVAETARIVDARAATPKTRDREWQRLALAQFRRDPVRPTLWKAAAFWRPWLHPAEYGRAMVFLSAIVSIGLFVFGAIGLARTPDRRLALAVVAFFVVMWLAHVPYIPTIRLRTPLVDPLLIVFSASVPFAARRASA